MTESLEDYDFTPSAGTNLRSLFNSSSPISESSSLIYTAPKQPKAGFTAEVKQEAAKPETSVLSARVVQVWKLTDGKYTAIGKHGCAIIGSSAQNSFEMILYKEKRNVIVRARICESYVLSLKKDDFASFYDNATDNWLIKFNSHDDCVAIVSQIEKCGGKVAAEEAKKTTVENHGGEKIDAKDNSPEKARNDILTRIAKMGQSILPNKTETSEDVLETIDTKAPSLNKSREHTDMSSALTPTNIPNVPSTVVITQPMGYDPLNVYVAENRAHNSELRMNLSQISEKLNSIMKLVDSGKSNHEPNHDVLTSKIKVLELRIENLTRELNSALKENTKLKLEMEHQDNILKRDKHLETELKILEEQKNAEIEELQRQILLSESKIAEFNQVSESQMTETVELKQQLESYQEQLQSASEIPSLRETISELQQKLSELEEQNQASEQDQEKTVSFTFMLKEEMNGMYANIADNFNKDQTISEINGVIAQNIKITTLRIIQNFQKIYHIQ